MNLENNMNLENIMKFGNYRKPSWNLKILNLENNMNLENIMKFGNYRKPSWNLKILNLENIHKFEEYHGICKYHWYFENIIEIWKISWNWKISQIWKILLKFGKSLWNLENITKLEFRKYHEIGKSYEIRIYHKLSRFFFTFSTFQHI